MWIFYHRYVVLRNDDLCAIRFVLEILVFELEIQLNSSIQCRVVYEMVNMYSRITKGERKSAIRNMVLESVSTCRTYTVIRS